MNFFDIFLNDDDFKISNIDGYNFEYKNLDIKKFNKQLKENENSYITLFFPIDNKEDLFEYIIKGVKTKNNNQTLTLYSNFTSAKIYSNVKNSDIGMLFKVDVKISKLSINKEKINELKILYPNIGNTLAESLIGTNSVKHKGKIYFDKIKSIILIDNKTNKEEELKLVTKYKTTTLEKLRKLFNN